MKKTSLQLALLISALSAGAAQAVHTTPLSTPLSRYLPAGALGTLEANNLRDAFEASKPLLKSLVNSVDPSMNFTSLELASNVLWGSIGLESSIGLYTVGTKDVQMLAVTRVNGAVSALITSQMRSSYPKGKPIKVGAFSFQKVGASNFQNMYIGMGGGLAYASSNYDLMKAFLRRLNGEKLPTLSSSAKYRGTVKTLESSQLKIYINWTTAVKVARNNLAEIYVPRILDPILESLNTLGQSGYGLSVLGDGIEGRAVQTLNPEGKEVNLYNLLTASKDEFSSARFIPANVYSVSTCALDPISEPRYWANWMTRLDLYDPTGILTDSHLVDTFLDASSWLGNEQSTVMLKPVAQNPNSLISTYQNQIWMLEVADEIKAEAVMKSFTGNFNTSLKKTLEYYRKLLPANLSGEAESLGLDPSMLAGLQPLLELLKGDSNLVYKIQNGYLFIGSDAPSLERFVNAPNKLADLPAYQALPRGGRCLDLTPKSLALTKANYRKLLESSLGSSASMLPSGMLNTLSAALERYAKTIKGSSGSWRVEGNQLIGQGKLVVNFR